MTCDGGPGDPAPHAHTRGQAALAATIVGTDAPGRLAGTSGAGNDAVNVTYLDERLIKDTVDCHPGSDTIIDTNLKIRTPDAYQNCENTISR